MQRAVLLNERAAVDGDHLAARECLADELACLQVVFGLAIDGYQHLVVGDQEVGISSRQPEVVVFINRFRQRQFDEVVMVAVNVGELLELLFHLHQWLEMFVVGVITSCIKNDAARSEACQRVDVAVGVVAHETVQTSTNTGRLSSRDPNLQNIPVKTELGEEIRKCFVAGPNKKLIAVDYSQIQLRLLADVANIKTFKDTFIAGADIHEQTARKIFNIPQTTIVPKDLRRAAKTVNFSIIYGISSIGLAAQLNVPRARAAEIINSYMAGLPEIKKYIDDTKEFARENARVYTPWGRRIELPEVRNSRLRAYAMRAAINAPIQGFEADLMRRAMVDVYNEIVMPNADKIKLIMQVHDEMVFECDEKLAESFAEQIKNIMENVTKISVPLRADYVIAPFWGK